MAIYQSLACQEVKTNMFLLCKAPMHDPIPEPGMSGSENKYVIVVQSTNAWPYTRA